jgi:hypothetical protein
MDWRDRRIFVALGAAAAAGLVFGMLLGVLRGGDGDGSSSRAAEQNQPTQTTPSESAEPTSTASSRPTIDSADYPENDFGFLRDLRSEDGRTVLVFDRAILLTGDAAQREAEKRHITLDNDYLITNDNKRLRDRVVAANVTATGSQILTGHPASTTIDPQLVYDYVRSHREPPLPVHLRYDRTTGQVIKIEEVYFP